jgi:hypothetical protein
MRADARNAGNDVCAQIALFYTPVLRTRSFTAYACWPAKRQVT